MRMSNFETALHLLPSFLVVVRKFQILTSTPFFQGCLERDELCGEQRESWW